MTIKPTKLEIRYSKLLENQLLNINSKVEIYTAWWCSPCQRAKLKLRERSISYVEIPVDCQNKHQGQAILDLAKHFGISEIELKRVDSVEKLDEYLKIIVDRSREWIEKYESGSEESEFDNTTDAEIIWNDITDYIVEDNIAVYRMERIEGFKNKNELKRRLKLQPNDKVTIPQIFCNGILFPGGSDGIIKFLDQHPNIKGAQQLIDALK